MARCGTYAGYTGGCRCPSCRAAQRAYMADYRRRRGQDGPLIVSPAEARAHIRRLQGVGMAPFAIARAAGIVPATVYRILEPGTARRIRRSVSEAICGVTVDSANGNLHAWRVRRLVAEMGRAGVSDIEIARALRMNEFQFTAMLSHRRHRYRTFARTATLYRLLARSGRVPASVLEEVGA